MNPVYVSFAILVFAITSCNEEYVSPSDCDERIIISKSEYNNAPNDDLTINILEIKDNCLIINYSASGCSGDSWELKLIDAGDILESYPPQRNVRLSLKNDELCDAYLTREISFDITSIQLEVKKLYLNIKNSGDQILYEY